MRRPKIQLDLRPYFQNEANGHQRKSMIVLHETVSHDRPGTGDLAGVAQFLDDEGLEIHGIIDAEANSAWCYDRRAIYDHTRSGECNVNSKSVGFEQVSDIPFLPTNALRKAAWDPRGPRRKQLLKVAEWCAWLHKSEGVPLVYSKGREPGITSHWSVSRTCLDGDGHWDCHPVHEGGHYPIMYVIRKAQQMLEGGEL
jgi:hypothetical protein